jgi:hypothetical protein
MNSVKQLMSEEQNVRAFLSCSLGEEGSPFVENVRNLAKSKGFSTGGTVGRFTQSPSNLLEYIEEEIKNYDCLIMAATPKYIQEEIQKKTKHNRSLKFFM